MELIGDARLSSQVPRLPTSQSRSGNLTNDYPTQDGEILHLSWKAWGKEWELVILVIVLSNQMVRYSCGFKDDAHLS